MSKKNDISAERVVIDAVDVEPLLQYPAYRELEKQEVFDTARLNGGTITWLNGAIDVSPEKVYEISYPYEG